MLLRRGRDTQTDTFRFSDGAPCEAAYHDLTPLLRELDRPV
jgi:hypothetical protein